MLFFFTEIVDVGDKPVDYGHFHIVEVVRDVHLVIMRIDKTSFARAEMLERIVIVSLFFTQAVLRHTPDTVFHHLVLEPVYGI